jgi:hypothetical protein
MLMYMFFGTNKITKRSSAKVREQIQADSLRAKKDTFWTCTEQ